MSLLFESNDGIALVTINRPDKLNALNAEVIEALGEVVDQVRGSPDIRAAVLTGAGPKAFVAGADIAGFQSLTGATARRFSQKGSGIFRSIERSPKPWIAAVNGFALGGGCELAMACHIRVASQNAKFGQPEVKLGLPPGYGGTVRLPRLIGKGRALELLITGGMIDAAEAYRIGLVNHVYPSDQLLAEADKLARAIVANAPLAIAACLELANTQDGMQLDDALALESSLFGSLLETKDAREGVKAFLEKRAATWSGE